MALLWLILPCFLDMISGLAENATSSFNNNDVESLLAFKKSVTHDPQKLLSNWDLHSSSPCNWTGITCSSDDPDQTQTLRVVHIYLCGGGIRATIPPQLGNLTALKVLNLSSNNLYGQIPASLGRLSNLTYINLGSNHLTGFIPAELGNLSSLLSLHLPNNSLRGQIPPSLAQIPKLTCLDVAFNYLESGTNSPDQPIPILKAFPRNSTLKDLQLQYNRFNGTLLPNMGPVFPLLQQMIVRGNNISGSIPDSMGSISNLFKLDLAQNHFSGTVPAQLGGCSLLDHLDLSENSFIGSISYQVTSLPNVRYLNFSCNNLSGKLPQSLGPMVEIIDVSHNRFTGSIPNWFFSVTSNISYNDLEGSIACGSAPGNSSLIAGNSNVTSDTCAHNGHQNKTVLFASIFSSLGIILWCIGMVFLFFFCKKRKKRTVAEEEETWEEPQFITLSHRELIQATGNFSPQNLLGQGRFGRVYKGTLPDGSGSSVAVKLFSVLEGEEDDDDNADKCFVRECQTLGKIRHRNLVKVITACSTERVKALILEFMPNGSLDGLLHKPIDENGRLMPLSLKTRGRILKEVASALSYLHHDCTPPIIHCDLKPHNVLLDEDMTPKLSDFGMAHIIGDSDLTKTITLQGSIGYIPPEYGVGGRLWCRGDVFSFGVLILEVVTRLRPTDALVQDSGLSMTAWVSMVLQGGPDNVKQLLLSREGQKRIQVESNQEFAAFEQYLRLGVQCSCEHPEKRPTMRQVELSLAKISIADDNADNTNKPGTFKDLESLIDYVVQGRHHVPPPPVDSTTITTEPSPPSSSSDFFRE